MISEFPKLTRSVFDSTLENLGYVCISESLVLVAYAGRVDEGVTVNIRYDNGRSYEVGVDFATPAPNAGMFTLGQLIGSAGHRQFDADGAQASTVEALTLTLNKLAQLTNQYAVELLHGDEIAVARARKFVSESAVRYGKERDAHAARSAADLAWSVRDYKKVVAALEKIVDQLSPAERSRLKYCHRQLGST